MKKKSRLHLQEASHIRWNSKSNHFQPRVEVTNSRLMQEKKKNNHSFGQEERARSPDTIVYAIRPVFTKWVT